MRDEPRPLARSPRHDPAVFWHSDCTNHPGSTMDRPILAYAAAVLALGLSARLAGQQPVNPRAEVLSHFQDRIDSYMQLREKAVSGVKKLDETMNPAQVTARQQSLGRAIANARATARPGDIFFPEVAELIKEAVRRDFRRRPAKERAAAVASVPKAPAVGINDPYPAAVPLATVPPKLLAELPRLPEELEYRFLGGRLILRDVDANLVIDFVVDALPGVPGKG